MANSPCRRWLDKGAVGADSDMDPQQFDLEDLEEVGVICDGARQRMRQESLGKGTGRGEGMRCSGGIESRCQAGTPMDRQDRRRSRSWQSR